MDRTAVRIRDTLVWVLCTYGLIHVLYFIGAEGSWLTLRDALGFTAGPPFNHRVLFVLIARGFRLLRPGLHDPAVYFLSQIIAGAAAMWLIQPWARRFVPGSVAVWSRPLLLVLLIPTFTYWTFYDIGIVFFFTAALLALTTGRWLLYLAVFALGILNHENMVLIVPIAIALRYRTWRIGVAGIAWVGAQLALYAAIRWGMFQILPATAAWQSGKLAYNLGLLHHPLSLMKTVVWLTGWGLVMWTARRRLPREIVIASFLLPEILIVSIPVGQLNELRLFNPCLPVLVVGILIAMSADSDARTAA
jgi:hypothetical protein